MYHYTKDSLETIIRESWSKAEVLRRLGIRPIGSNYRTLNSKILEFNIDISHFTGQSYRKGLHTPVFPQKSLVKCLAKNSKNNSHRLKLRLIQEGIKKHQCEICMNIDWQGVPIPIELDHINGINSDNRLENLRIICPNCHALTPNYRGKNKKSALAEMREVEYRKFRETPVEITRGNPEPSLQEVLQEGQETRHDKSNVSKIQKQCKCCGKHIYYNKVFCSTECYKIHNRKNIPKVPELLIAFSIYKNYRQVGKYFNVSDNTVRKWIIMYGIETMIKV